MRIPPLSKAGKGLIVLFYPFWSFQGNLKDFVLTISTIPLGASVLKYIVSSFVDIDTCKLVVTVKIVV